MAIAISSFNSDVGSPQYYRPYRKSSLEFELLLYITDVKSDGIMSSDKTDALSLTL